MWRYYELLSFRPLDEIARAEARVRRGPQSARRQGRARAGDRRALPLAGGGGARARRIRGAVPAGRAAGGHAGGHAARRAGAGLPIAQLAKQAGIVDSTSEALRLIAQRGLKVDGDVVADKALVIAAGRTVVVQAGKRKFARVTVR